MLHPEKYNALIYYMKKVKDISKDLSTEDLTIISEQLKIAESQKKIEKILTRKKVKKCQQQNCKKEQEKSM